MTLIDYVTTALVTLLVVVDPPGLGPIFLGVTGGMTKPQRAAVAWRAAAIAACVLAFFALAGEPFLRMLGITAPAFRLAGGLLLFYIAFEMVFDRRFVRKSTRRGDCYHQGPHLQCRGFPARHPADRGAGRDHGDDAPRVAGAGQPCPPRRAARSDRLLDGELLRRVSRRDVDRPAARRHRQCRADAVCSASSSRPWPSSSASTAFGARCWPAEPVHGRTPTPCSTGVSETRVLRRESRHPCRTRNICRPRRRCRRRCCSERDDAPSARTSRNPTRHSPAPPRRPPARHRPANRGASSRPGSAAARPPSSIFPGPTGRCICASAAVPRHRPSSPCVRYCSATLARFSLKITTLCHSVRSLRSPLALSRQLSVVARRRLTTGSPELSRRTSGSRPRLPTRMTLLTEPDIATPFPSLQTETPGTCPSLCPVTMTTL